MSKKYRPPKYSIGVLPIYFIPLFSEHDVVKTMASIGVNDYDLPGCDHGKTYVVSSDGCVTTIIIYINTNFDIQYTVGLIAHESYHAMNFAYEHVNAKGCEEINAYSMQYISETVFAEFLKYNEQNQRTI